ncbi:uncharacterized protein [Temnothorax nylanderi]|uniref:uncharacterized protein isoform X2 n=1 Tax=Temnothorax nylanderi TaxID=102681 RepID=UPI003A8526FC
MSRWPSRKRARARGRAPACLPHAARVSKDLKMSDDSADSTVGDDDEEEENRRARGGRTDGRMARLKALFCCLGRGREPRADGTVGYDPDECDYVVEKLVVRRVPLALFAIPADLADNATRGAGGASTRLGTDRRSATNKTLRFADKRRDSIDRRLDCRAKSSDWRDGIPSKFNDLRPDLRESERPLEDPLNFSRNRQLFAEDISEVTSSTRTDVTSWTTSSATVQDDIPTRDDSTHRGSFNPLFGSEREPRAERDEAARDASSRKERDKFVPGRNRKYIVSPFRVRRGSLDLAKPAAKGVVGDLGVDGKSLSYIEESLEDKSTEPTGDAKDRDLESNTAVRWRITVRRQRANATLEHDVSKPYPSLEGKTHR